MRRIIAISVAAALLALAGAAPTVAQQNMAFEAELHHFSAPQGTCEDGV